MTVKVLQRSDRSIEPGRKENAMPARVEITGDVARIILSGEFDFSTQENLGSAFEQALNSDATKEIRVDLADTTFIDSSVIRALLKLRESAIAVEKPLSLWNCNEHIQEIFAIGGFDQMFVMR